MNHADNHVFRNDSRKSVPSRPVTLLAVNGSTFASENQ
jgi:hypothetical protein